MSYTKKIHNIINPNSSLRMCVWCRNIVLQVPIVRWHQVIIIIQRDTGERISGAKWKFLKSHLKSRAIDLVDPSEKKMITRNARSRPLRVTGTPRELTVPGCGALAHARTYDVHVYAYTHTHKRARILCRVYSLSTPSRARRPTQRERNDPLVVWCACQSTRRLAIGHVAEQVGPTTWNYLIYIYIYIYRPVRHSTTRWRAPGNYAWYLQQWPVPSGAGKRVAATSTS